MFLKIIRIMCIWHTLLIIIFLLLKITIFMALLGIQQQSSGVYQYFSPSFYTIPGSFTSEETLTFPDISSEYSDSIFDRADFPQIFICGFIILIIFAFVINNLTRLVKKGGILFSSN